MIVRISGEGQYVLADDESSKLNDLENAVVKAVEANQEGEYEARHNPIWPELAAVLTEHDPTELAPEEIVVGDRVIYQWCPDGFLEAPALGPFVEKHLGVRATGRNWNTVTKLAELLSA